ncbi:hypothetical protein BT69DRAFT_667663 [Atractiella rhizophila]|nr:hypothetical protein BT69DRAFT_667663 [Atractiella rhizophila]
MSKEQARLIGGAAMREAQLRIEALTVMERNRALTAAENQELTRHRMAIRDLEHATRQHGAALGSTLALPGVRARANSIGHVGHVGGVGVSPRMPGLPMPGTGMGAGIMRPVTPTRMQHGVGGVVATGGMLAPGVMTRPRARSFGAAAPRPVGLAPSPRMVPVSHSPRMMPVSHSPRMVPMAPSPRMTTVHASPGLRPMRSATNIRTVQVPVGARTPRVSTSGATDMAVQQLRAELERMRMSNNMNEREREMLAVKERELARQTAELERRKDRDMEDRERRMEQRLSELEKREREQDRLLRTPGGSMSHAFVDPIGVQRPRTPGGSFSAPLRTPGGTVLHDFVADPMLEPHVGLTAHRASQLGVSPRWCQHDARRHANGQWSQSSVWSRYGCI